MQKFEIHFSQEELADLRQRLTGTASSAARVYYGNTWTLPEMKKLNTPTAILSFAHDVLPVPQSWIKRRYPLVMYEALERGGHFTALENPQEFAENMKKFIALLQ